MMIMIDIDMPIGCIYEGENGRTEYCPLCNHDDVPFCQHIENEPEAGIGIDERPCYCPLMDTQPEPEWIPCTPETMPEEKEWIGTKRFGTTISDKVLVTFERPDGSRFVKDLCFQNGKLSSFDQHSIDVFNKGSIPIRWKPWPEPYQEEE